MKILKHSADKSAPAQTQSHVKFKTSGHSGGGAPVTGARAPAVAAAQVPAEERPEIIFVKATLGQWVLATAGGIVAGLVLGFVVFNVLKVNW